MMNVVGRRPLVNIIVIVMVIHSTIRSREGKEDESEEGCDEDEGTRVCDI